MDFIMLMCFGRSKMDFIMLMCFFVLGIWGFVFIDIRINNAVKRLKEENACLKSHIIHVEDRLDKLWMKQQQ